MELILYYDQHGALVAYEVQYGDKRQLVELDPIFRTESDKITPEVVKGQEAFEILSLLTNSRLKA